ncbi:MAG: 1-deoxy-D-xylulose-5-phosphate synthase, partial [Eubacterium sp.]|nr:1-deoxy-D-xylulose-5-phosphate synthase [Eubacterium sp.]
NMRFIKPFDESLVKELTLKHRVVVTIEDGTRRGGFGEQIGAFLTAEKISVKSFVNIALPDAFIEHGSRDELFEKYGLDASKIYDRVLDAYSDSK